jgi:hypothetical protein
MCVVGFVVSLWVASLAQLSGIQGACGGSALASHMLWKAFWGAMEHLFLLQYL